MTKCSQHSYLFLFRLQMETRHIHLCICMYVCRVSKLSFELFLLLHRSAAQTIELTHIERISVSIRFTNANNRKFQLISLVFHILLLRATLLFCIQQLLFLFLYTLINFQRFAATCFWFFLHQRKKFLNNGTNGRSEMEFVCSPI